MNNKHQPYKITYPQKESCIYKYPIRSSILKKLKGLLSKKGQIDDTDWDLNLLYDFASIRINY